MIIVALADIHGDTRRLGEFSQDLTAADVILLVGDVTHFGLKEAASQVVEAVRKYNDRILAVPGNCDHPEVNAYLNAEGMSLDRKTITIGEVAFLGIGGSLPCPGRTPNEYSDSELKAFLEEAASDLRPEVPTILVAHQPPRDTVADLAFDGNHVGSESLRAFITEVQPLLCFTGHIHEARGIDSIGRTKIVNPGPLREGHYAYASVQRRVEKVEIRGS